MHVICIKKNCSKTGLCLWGHQSSCHAPERKWSLLDRYARLKHPRVLLDCEECRERFLKMFLLPK